MTKCRECGADIAGNATQCPKCGKRFASSGCLGCAAIVAALAAVLYFYWQ